MIKVNNISYTIDGKNILSNINLNIIRNKITVITGKNGSGKSSLIKIINKIIIPNKGPSKFQNLSEGEKQKVFISRLMSYEQDLIILDEPNQNLDLESEKIFFTSLSKVKNKTILLSLHNMSLVKKFADYVIVLDSGKIIFNDISSKFF
jgi:energy-coupling factor transporter ATP-binding protein EcfA2